MPISTPFSLRPSMRYGAASEIFTRSRKRKNIVSQTAPITTKRNRGTSSSSFSRPLFFSRNTFHVLRPRSKVLFLLTTFYVSQRPHVRILADLEPKGLGLVQQIEGVTHMGVVDHHAVVGHGCFPGPLGFVHCPQHAFVPFDLFFRGGEDFVGNRHRRRMNQQRPAIAN